jgi:hypothetical protein
VTGAAALAAGLVNAQAHEGCGGRVRAVMRSEPDRLPRRRAPKCLTKSRTEIKRFEVGWTFALPTLARGGSQAGGSANYPLRINPCAHVAGLASLARDTAKNESRTPGGANRVTARLQIKKKHNCGGSGHPNPNAPIVNCRARG